MAVRIIFGAPRSGKTYYAVNHLTTTYFDEGEDGLFTLKPKFANLVIFANIDNLKLPHKDLSEAIRTTGGPDKFFSYDYQEKVFRKYPQVCYFIDEAQMIFPDNFRENKVFNWFQYHGHWGQDVYLMTQDIKLLPRQITVLSEITIKALPRSTSILGGRDLRYNLMLGAGSEIGDKIVLLKKQKIFNLYCSQNSTEANKVKNPFIKYFVILALAMVFAAWHFRNLIVSWSSGSANVSASVAQSIPGSSSSSASSSGSSSSPVPFKGTPGNPATPAPDLSTWLPVSYLIQGKRLFIVYDNQLLPARDLAALGYELKVGAFNRLLALVKDSQAHLFRQPSDDAPASSRDTNTGDYIAQHDP